MKSVVVLSLAAAAALGSLPAAAGPKCTDAPRSQRLPEATMKQRILKDGYSIDTFKISGQCYEIYGTVHGWRCNCRR